jgi:two-component system, LuxR family, sensor kinase FixL
LRLNIDTQILQSVYDTSTDAIIVIDDKAMVQSLNHTAERLFGYAATEVLGKNIKMLMPPYYADRHDGFMQRYHETGEKRIIGMGRIVTGQRKDGSTFPLELSIGEAKGEGPKYYTGFIRDLTERQHVEQRMHELQEELIHASRLASLGEISSMIAHEANQPLSAAGTYLEIAKELLASADSEARTRGFKALDQATAQIRRVGDTVRRIREFAKKKTPELGLEDINRIVEEANGIAAVGTKDKSIRTKFDLASALPEIMADRIQVQQVVMNLVRNSMEAMTGWPKRDLVLMTRLRDETHIEVAVIDTGPGVSEAVAKSLFTPFMSTKASGTGLGLAICHSIVEAHGGKLWHENTANGGATFKFTLPIQNSAVTKND